jgi:ABC-type dipeptide/oligopeptide/nickel transport system permease component/ABC-type dipeptide/oligopeptide/nickel transport system permease subunit
MRDKSKVNLRILRKISIAILQGILVLFIGLLISFFFFDRMTTNPNLNKLPVMVDPEVLEEILEEIGYYDPVIIRFGKYVHNFFYGNWGESHIVWEGEPITKMMRRIGPITIETMILPLLIGLIGIKLGKIWVKKRDKLTGSIIQIFTVIGLAMPIFFMATLMQVEYSDDLPVLFYTDPGMILAPRVTGFPLFDAFLEGDWVLFWNIIKHGILPVITLSFVITALIIKQTQTNLEHNSKDTAFVSNSFTAVKILGILFAFIILVEITFNRRGFGYYFLTSIYAGDFLVINGYLFMIIMLFSVIIMLANIFPIAYKFLRKKAPNKIKLIRKNIRSKIENYREKVNNLMASFKGRDKASAPLSQPIIEVEKKYKTKPRIELKNYFFNSLKNPYTIVGLGLMIFLVFIAVFAPWLTEYPLQEITPPYIPMGEDPFDPPSAAHPLGTTKYGYDVLARILYGTGDALLFGFLITLFGLTVGSIFSYFSYTSHPRRLHLYIHNGIISLLLVVFIIPGIILLILCSILFGIAMSMMMIGLLLAASFTGIIINAMRRESNPVNIVKIVIKYFPLEMAFGIMLYQILGFLGLADETTPQLGVSFNYGRASFSNEWALFWPGMYIFVISLSLILIHEGLEAPTVQRDVLNSPAISS